MNRHRGPWTPSSSIVLSWFALVIGCSPVPEASVPERDLGPGASGPDVEKVHEYLRQYGYFPSEALAHRYPAWRPVVARSPRDWSRFDDTSAQAIRALQQLGGLEQTGVVDQPTRALLGTPRCEEPEGIPRADPSQKFAPHDSKWPRTDLTYKVNNGDDVTLNEARLAMSSALLAWAGATDLRFEERMGTAPADIEVTFKPVPPPTPPGTVAGAYQPSQGGDIFVAPQINWTVIFPTPPGFLDLQTVLLHELGHALGLRHSSFGESVMYPFVQGARWALHIDDKVAISYLYDSWEVLPGGGRDIAVNRNGAPWLVGSNPVGTGADFGIYVWNGQWNASDGGGVRIAVDPIGIPWIVNSSDQIWRRNSANTQVPGWTLMPGGGKDIGIGADGSVWIIGANPIGSGDFGIYKWSGSAWLASDGGGLRIAVGPEGLPWIVNSSGQIWRRTSTDPATPGWEQLPGSARDIGIQDWNFAWIIGRDSVPGGSSISLWNWQPLVGPANTPDSPPRNHWLKFSGGGTAISVGPDGRPWIVNNAGQVARTRR